MQAATNRTFICSIVFLDIVEYSKKPVAEQIVFKERLNGMLTEALANVALNDRIILDTGDGAALSFLGDPEDALFASLALRDELAAPQLAGPQMQMRIGINLGPVKLVKDINGQPNIIGDGINVAQRVMSFALPGQVLVSRSYYEVVSRMSEEYGRLFHFEGSRTDKHVREHEVYAVQSTGTPLHRIAAPRARGETSSQSRPLILDKLAQTASLVTGSLRRRPRVSTAVAVAAILAVAVGLRVHRQAPATPVAPSVAPTMAAAPTTTAPTTAAPSAAAPAPAKSASSAAAETASVATPPEKKTAKPPASSPSAPATAAKSSTSKEPVAKAAAAPPTSGKSGTLMFTVKPWGEVYVDGRHVGTAPPLYKFSASPGRHRIEIQNPEFPSYVQTVELQSGGQVDVRHTFLPKDQPNPLKWLWKK
jgi:hypothetical protein